MVVFSMWYQCPSRDSIYGVGRVVSPLFQMIQWRFEFVHWIRRSKVLLFHWYNPTWEGGNFMWMSHSGCVRTRGRGGQSRGSRVRNHSHCFEEEISHVSSISVHLRRDHLAWDFRISAREWSFGENFTLWIIKLIIIPHRHVCKGHAINFICTHGLIILLLCWPQGLSHVSNQLVVYLGRVRLLLCWPQGLSHVSNQLVIYLWLYLDTF